MRDLLQLIGVERATIVGHSLGGGVAMQLAYQHPELCERLVLVSSGGLGHSVSPLLRAAALPGSEWVLPVIAGAAGGLGAKVGGVLARVGLRAGNDMAEVGRGMADLGDREARLAFLDTLRAVVGPGGQRVSALDRLYLAADLPLLIVWGDCDPIIPVGHGRRAHDGRARQRDARDRGRRALPAARRPRRLRRPPSIASSPPASRGATTPPACAS